MDVDTVEEGVKLMKVLAAYDKFQFDQRVKPDYCNAGGLQAFDPEDDTDSPDGSWCDWCDEETGEDDPFRYLAAFMGARQCSRVRRTKAR